MPIVVALVLWMRRGRFSGPIVILGGLAISLLGNAAGLMYFDGASFGDSIWYSIISITTIGYGDFSASSTGARICTVVFIIIFGLAIFSAALGLAIEFYSNIVEKGLKGMCKIHSTNHVVVINFPGDAPLTRLIDELSKDPEYKDREVVVVSDQIEELPIRHKHLQFVSGSPLLPKTLTQANIQKAHTAIVLTANDKSPQDSDAVGSSVVLLIEEMNKDVHTIAMCADPDHRFLFEKSKTDSIVCGPLLSMNLLVQEMQDHGISHVFETITSNDKGSGDTVYSTFVNNQNSYSVYDYSAIAKGLLDHNITLICVTRDGKHHTSFKKLGDAKMRDNLVYIASRRYGWEELYELTKSSPIPVS